MNDCDSRNLTIEKRWSSAYPGKPSPFARMALRGSRVIGKDR